jgi:CO/xanthine dehydrogenase FAD-binding subunit
VIFSMKDPTRCEDIRIVVGAVASTPMRARKAEETMREEDGRRSHPKAAQVASEEVNPRPGSIRGSVEYKGRW